MSIATSLNARFISNFTTMEATPYRVSTITCNGSIGSSVDLTELYSILPLMKDSDAFGFIYVMDRHGKESKGISPRKKSTKSKNQEKERRFDNAISTYFKIQDQYTPSVKIFKNGTIQMTGLKTIVDGEKLHRMVFETMLKVYPQFPNVFEKEPVFQSNVFYIRLINSDFSVPYLIRRKDLHRLLISDAYQNSCSFQPEKYPGVKLQYFWNPVIGTQNGVCNCTQAKCFGKGNGNGHGQCKKVTISLFESGKILITGAVNFEQINDAYGYITKVLKDNYGVVHKEVLV